MVATLEKLHKQFSSESTTTPGQPDLKVEKYWLRLSGPASLENTYKPRVPFEWYNHFIKKNMKQLRQTNQIEHQYQTTQAR